MINNTKLIFVSRIVIGVILIYAGVNKLSNPNEFASAIDNYHLLPFGSENLVAIIMPWIEILAGIGLILGIYVNGSALIALVMFGIFIIAIASALVRGYNIECGCGIKAGDMVGIDKILENTVYFALAWLILKRKSRALEIYPKSV
jgi:uncharacterized membrane protein YphA (DoxX/SURF4 family)